MTTQPARSPTPLPLNLAVFKTHAPAPGTISTPAGGSIEYILTLTNSSQGVAHNVTLTDSLPDSLTFQDGTLHAPSDWDASIDGRTIALTHSGTFAPGSSATISYRTTVATVAHTSAGMLESISNTGAAPPWGLVVTAIALTLTGMTIIRFSRRHLNHQPTPRQRA